MKGLQSEQLGTKDEVRCCAGKDKDVPPLMAVQQHIEFARQKSFGQSQHVDHDANRIHGIHDPDEGEDLRDQRVSECSLEKYVGCWKNSSSSKSAKNEESKPTKPEILKSWKGKYQDPEQCDQRDAAQIESSESAFA